MPIESLPANLQPNPGGLFRIINAINQMMTGRTNAAGQVTLAATGTTTVVTNDLVSESSKPVLTPANAAAAAEAAAGTLYVSNTVNGSFTINHQAGVSGRIFNYLIFG